MAGKNTAVFGIYPNRSGIEYALGVLKDAGFRNTDVSVLLPENLGTKDLATEKATKAPEGATAGAASGAVIGGAFGWLVGIGALAIPGLGAFIAAGPLVAALAGVGAGGAVGGLQAPSSAREFRNTRPSATRDASGPEASCFPSIAIAASGPKKPRKLSRLQARMTFHQPARHPPILPNRIAP